MIPVRPVSRDHLYSSETTWDMTKWPLMNRTTSTLSWPRLLVTYITGFTVLASVHLLTHMLKVDEG